MLIARRGCLTRLVWSFHPVPSAISVATQSPCIAETRLICGTTSKAHHHTGCTARLTKSCRVVNSRRWLIATTIKLIPTEWRPFNTKAPYVIYWLRARVSAIDEQVRF